jgi:hypothetical protein
LLSVQDLHHQIRGAEVERDHFILTIYFLNTLNINQSSTERDYKNHQIELPINRDFLGFLKSNHIHNP